VWALLFLVMGSACLLFSVTGEPQGTDSNDWQALFLFLGLLLLIPAALALILGLVLVPVLAPECPMPCYFPGTDWC
jgi:hypothetical protein